MSEAQLKFAKPKELSVYDQIESELTNGEAVADRAATTAALDAEKKEKMKGVYEANAQAAREIKQSQRNAAMIGMVGGVHIEVAKIGRNVGNAVYGLANAVEDFAASKGLGSGDLLNDTTKWTDASSDAQDGKLGIEGNVAQAFARVAIPMAFGIGAAKVAGLAGKAALASGIGVDTSYAFLADSPDDQHLLDAVKGTWVDEIPGVFEAMEYVRKKPEDSEMIKRTKNAVVAMGFSTAMGTMIEGISYASRARAGKKVLENPTTVTAVEKETAKMQDTIKNPAPSRTVELPTDGTVLKTELAQAKPAPNVADTPPQNAIVGSPDDVTLYQGVRANNVDGRDGDSGWWTTNKGEAQLHADREGPGGVIREIKASQIPDDVFTLDEAGTQVSRAEYFKHRSNVGISDPSRIKPATPASAVGSPEEAADLAKMETSPTFTSPDTPEQMDIFEKQWATMGLDAPPVTLSKTTGAPVLTLQSDTMLGKLEEIVKASPEGVYRIPLTDAQTAAVVAVLKKDPSYADNLIKNFTRDTVLSDVDTHVVNYSLFNTDKEWQEYILAYNASGTLDEKLAFQRKFEGYTRMSDIVSTNESNHGVALRAHQLPGIMFGTTEKNGLALMGAQGRAVLAKALMYKYGGEAAHEKMAAGLKMIAAIPDNQFRFRMGEVIKMSKYERINNAVTKVALNGMTLLSAKGAAVANFAMMNKLLAEKYVQAANPRSIGSFEEANASAWGMYSAIQDGLKVGWSRGVNAKNGEDIAHLDLIAGTVQLTSQADRAIQSGLISWGERGVQLVEQGAEILSAKGFSTRALVGVDAAYNHVIYQGLLRGAAVREARRLGKFDHELPAFMQDFLNKPPDALVQKLQLLSNKVTLSNDPEGILGRTMTAVSESEAYKQFPTARVIAPFLRTTTNGFLQFVENSPLAAATPTFWRAMKSTEPGVADDAITKVMTGIMGITGLMVLAHNGVISGGYSENKDVNRAMQGGDFPTNTSVKIGETWYKSDNLGYLSSMINIASYLNRASTYLSDEEYSEYAHGFAVVVAENTIPDNLTDNISGLIAAGDMDKRGLKWLNELPLRYLPFGSGLNAIRSEVDPIKRDIQMDNFFDMLVARTKNRIPGLSDDLPADRNFFGETITLPTGFARGVLSSFAPSDDDKGRGVEIKKSMDNLTMYQSLHKDDPIPPTALDFGKPPTSVPGFRQTSEGAQPTGLEYKLTPFEQSAYEKLRGGVDFKTNKPYPTDEFGTAVSLKDRFYSILKDHGLLNVPYTKIDRRKYELAVTKMKDSVMTLDAQAKNRIRRFDNVQYNMNLQAQKALEFKQVEGLTNEP